MQFRNFGKIGLFRLIVAGGLRIPTALFSPDSGRMDCAFCFAE